MNRSWIIPADHTIWRKAALTAVLGLGVACFYFAAAKLGLSMAFVAEQVTPVWPPTGIALAAVLLFGNRVWPGIALGAFLANATAHEPLGTAAGIALGNTLEAVTAAWLLRRFARFDPTLGRTRDVMALILCGAILSTSVSATVGATSLCLGRIQPWSAFGSLWWLWWFGDAMGALVMAPLLLTWFAGRRDQWTSIEAAEVGILLTALVIANLSVFGGLLIPENALHPLVYIVFPFVIWAALRFGQAETTAVTTVASGIAICGTVHGHGPFAKGDTHESLILLQFFMAAVAATGLLLGAAIAERRRAERRAAAQYATARVLAEWRTLDGALPRLLEAICRDLDWDVGAVWIVDRDDDMLHLAQLWQVSTRQAPTFEAESRRQRFPPGVGLPGRVWATGKPLWLTNVIDDANFPRVAAAAREGLRGAFGVPIIVGGEARGILEFFSRDVRPPDDKLLEAMAVLGHQVGQFIERTRAEEVGRASEARKAAILETALDCIISIDEDGRVIEWNPAAEQTFGYRRAEAVGRPMAELIVPPQLREQHYHGMARFFATGEGPVLGKRIEITGMRKGGSEFPVELSISVIRRSARPAFTAYLRDITEQRQAAIELSRSEERYRSFIHQSSEGIWRAESSELLSVDRPEDELIADFYQYVSLAECNDAFARMYGHASAEEIIGTPLEDLLPSSDPHNVEYLRAFIRSGFRLNEAESHEIDREGNPKVFLNNLIGIVRDGRLLRAWGTQRDITEQRRAEAELREADRRKDEFLAMLAHELRNPLSAISNAAALDREPIRTEEDHRWSQDVIERQISHLARLVDDLLDISRITRGKIALRKESVDAGQILVQAVEAVRPLIRDRGHDLNVSVAPGPLPLVADATRLEQIAVNLLTNAAKYTEHGGRIWLSARHEGDEIVIRVGDTGIGIPAEKIPAMFELFIQGDRSLARSEGGLGIGLTLVKKLAEMHGGGVSARSEGPGTGSEFTVRLPAAKEIAIERGRRTSVAEPGKKPHRVLVVDDNEDTAEGLAKLLTRAGHEVQTAYDGPSAIAIARARQPDVVLLDIGLPGMDGYEVAALVKKEECCKEALLIAITGYGQEEDRRRSHEAGFAHHLVKPIDFETLMSLVEQ